MTHVMGHWARAQPQNPRGPWAWPARFWGLGPGPGPMAHDVGPMSYGHVLCPMALSYVLWPCPMSYGPVLCPMALAILGIQEGSLNPDILI